MCIRDRFPPPDIGDDAVGAEVVAAIHDRQKGLERTVPLDRQTLGDDAVLLRDLDDQMCIRDSSHPAELIADI